MPMRQSGTDRGTRHETGEREPKGTKASDRTGERASRNSRPDSTAGNPEGKAKGLPAAKASDGGGERGGKLINGVGMGEFDGHGRAGGSTERGEYNTGRSESNAYTHNRKSYQ